MRIVISPSPKETHMTQSATLTIQKWGNGLALRIPASVARAARFSEGLQVEVSADATGMKIRPVGTRRPTLEEKLALFDPVKHGGEAMSSAPVGAENPLEVLRGSVLHYEDPTASVDAEWDSAR